MEMRHTAILQLTNTGYGLGFSIVKAKEGDDRNAVRSSGVSEMLPQ
jgi:hypothetical protein